MRSWRPLFATSFGLALLTVTHPRYSAYERVGGVNGRSEGCGAWPSFNIQAPQVWLELSRVDVCLSRTRSIPLFSSGGHFLLMPEATLKPRETSGRLLRYRIERQQTSSADRASEGVKRSRAASSVLLATRHFALFLRSWRPIFATSFGPAPLTLIDPRYSVHERVQGVKHCSQRWRKSALT